MVQVFSGSGFREELSRHSANIARFLGYRMIFLRTADWLVALPGKKFKGYLFSHFLCIKALLVSNLHGTPISILPSILRDIRPHFWQKRLQKTTNLARHPHHEI